jgi:WD40 repeat protein
MRFHRLASVFVVLLLTGSSIDIAPLASAAPPPTARREVRGFQLGSPSLCVAISPDSKTLAAGDWGKTVWLWDLATGKQRFKLVGHRDQVTAVAFSPDGKALASAGSWNETKLWDIARGQGQLIRSPTVTDGFTRSLGFASDGKALVALSTTGEIYLCDVPDGKELARHRTKQDFVPSAISSDGKSVALALKGKVRIFEVASGKQRCEFEQEGSVDALAWSSDGKELATGDDAQQTVRRWDATSGKELHKWRLAAAGVSSLAYAPDGKRLAVGGNKVVRLCEAETGKVLKAWDGHGDRVVALAFAPNGKLLASAGGHDGTVRVWAVPVSK